MKISPETIKEIQSEAKKGLKENKMFFRQLSVKAAGKVDEAFHKFHDEVFAGINCLECANCCKALGPKLNSADIRRISGALRIKPSVFETQYLRVDEDNDFVFNTMPCVFLEADNTCSVYQDRPRACREYPHTDQRHIHKVLDITLKNMSTCPAVFEIVERLKKVKI